MEKLFVTNRVAKSHLTSPGFDREIEDTYTTNIHTQMCVSARVIN